MPAFTDAGVEYPSPALVHEWSPTKSAWSCPFEPCWSAIVGSRWRVGGPPGTRTPNLWIVAEHYWRILARRRIHRLTCIDARGDRELRPRCFRSLPADRHGHDHDSLGRTRWALALPCQDWLQVRLHAAGCLSVHVVSVVACRDPSVPGLGADSSAASLRTFSPWRSAVRVLSCRA
jgi:hypothetical protein